MPHVNPKPKPSNVNSGVVPKRPSTHRPPTPGKTISKETVISREAQEAATATGERSSGGLVTAGQRGRFRNDANGRIAIVAVAVSPLRPFRGAPGTPNSVVASPSTVHAR